MGKSYTRRGERWNQGRDGRKKEDRNGEDVNKIWDLAGMPYDTPV